MLESFKLSPQQKIQRCDSLWKIDFMFSNYLFYNFSYKCTINFFYFLFLIFYYLKLKNKKIKKIKNKKQQQQQQQQQQQLL